MKGKKETSQIAPPGRYGRHTFAATLWRAFPNPDEFVARCHVCSNPAPAWED